MNTINNVPANLREFLERDAVRVAANNPGRNVGPMLTWDEREGFVREWGNWPSIWVAIPYTPEQMEKAEAAFAIKSMALDGFPVLDGETEAQFCARAQAAGVA